jgi:hypothetical protein
MSLALISPGIGNSVVVAWCLSHGIYWASEVFVEAADAARHGFGLVDPYLPFMPVQVRTASSVCRRVDRDLTRYNTGEPDIEVA